MPLKDCAPWRSLVYVTRDVLDFAELNQRGRAACRKGRASTGQAKPREGQESPRKTPGWISRSATRTRTLRRQRRPGRRGRFGWWRARSWLRAMSGYAGWSTLGGGRDLDCFPSFNADNSLPKYRTPHPHLINEFPLFFISQIF